ncbi:hypothetical protein GCM10010211_59890 [Streptomyces albospinus]|uniref:Uncharacterized protein n=1 Tax=Streptomyces albospinus TaxID=285515 RepID=A0ABQ2VIA5_9ACTN|nr:hypothetical protein [Streptomyces albospinus]GGU85911.1 hypothetical protein GCM10010211_59890 [Streptomyces albospinus]
MSDITKTTATGTTGASTSGFPPHPRPEPAAREAYAFACMSCGHGWEQAYEIEHQVDGKGQMHVVYFADGQRVPSPLTRPTCQNCGGHVVRIMRAGQVSMVSEAIASMHHRPHGAAKSAKSAKGGRTGQDARPAEPGSTGAAAEPGRHHHWHLSDLLHPFQHHRK